MPEYAINLLLQIPLVGIFAWFVLQRDAEWRLFLENMQRQNQIMLDEITNALERTARQLAKNTVAILIHDTTVRGVNPEALGDADELLKRVLGHE